MPSTAVAVLNSSCSAKLTHWCRAGNTAQKTAAIRSDDSKGRHTTTARSMHFTTTGAVLIDTPGMRELQLTDCDAGIRRTFADIDALATACRFNNCQHTAEPGCAVQQAIVQGELDARRLTNYQKLNAEQARNAASLQQRREKERQFSKLVKSVTSLKAKKYAE